MPGEVRLLTTRHIPAVGRLLDSDVVAHCFIAARLAEASATGRLAGELWGWIVDGEVESVMFAGANMVPARTTPLARLNFADRARRFGRRCSSIVGPADEALDLWRLLAPAWGPAREVRDTQPLMAISEPPRVPGDPRTRALRISELDLLLPAAVAMFTDEVGVSPLAGGGGQAYRSRLAELVRAGRSLGIVSGGRVIFKAEVGAVTAQCCQLQGVWVAPDLRGSGLGTAGMAAVAAHAQAHFAPVVSLYVNDYNTRALATYRRVGFTQVGTLATILF